MRLPVALRLTLLVGVAVGAAFFVRMSLARQFLYPVPPVSVPAPPLPLEELRLTTDRGDEVIAWRLPSAGDAARTEVPRVLVLHGNGENLETMRWSGLFESWSRLGVEVMAIDYPGYGRSSGAPSEAGNVAATEAALAVLSAAAGGAPVVVAGWSLGAAVGLQAVARRPQSVSAVVAMSPWSRLEDVARVHFPGWLVGIFLGERYDSLAAAAAVSCPALVLHGSEDAIIPVSQGAALGRALPAARFVAVPGAGHNDLLARAEVWEELAAFFAREVSPGAEAESDS